jgi:hypothetical protein
MRAVVLLLVLGAAVTQAAVGDFTSTCHYCALETFLASTTRCISFRRCVGILLWHQFGLLYFATCCVLCQHKHSLHRFSHRLLAFPAALWLRRLLHALWRLLLLARVKQQRRQHLSLAGACWLSVLVSPTPLLTTHWLLTTHLLVPSQTSNNAFTVINAGACAHTVCFFLVFFALALRCAHTHARPTNARPDRPMELRYISRW